jgi:hypothetical protein
VAKKIVSAILACCLVSACGKHEPPLTDAAGNTEKLVKGQPKADTPFFSLNKTSAVISVISVFGIICLVSYLRTKPVGPRVSRGVTNDGFCKNSIAAPDKPRVHWILTKEQKARLEAEVQQAEGILKSLNERRKSVSEKAEIAKKWLENIKTEAKSIKETTINKTQVQSIEEELARIAGGIHAIKIWLIKLIREKTAWEKSVSKDKDVPKNFTEAEKQSIKLLTELRNRLNETNKWLADRTNYAENKWLECERKIINKINCIRTDLRLGAPSINRLIGRITKKIQTSDSKKQKDLSTRPLIFQEKHNSFLHCKI